MHDRDGNPLKVGDKVYIPCVVESLDPQADYCNVSLKSVHGRRPDGALESIQAINTGVLVKGEVPPVHVISVTHKLQLPESIESLVAILVEEARAAR